MSSSVTTTKHVEPMQRSSAEQRADREAVTRELFDRRECSTDQNERQELLGQIVELNLEIARGIARRFDRRGAESDDLAQVACLGLMKAAKRYFRDSAWMVRIPRRLQERGARCFPSCRWFGPIDSGTCG
ncbi:sigma factor [Kribbella sp. NPDC051718]|uniref:sigma factor n=1 Tax=Kribbella sp. NPDC051718 TaxID=3155168 RepID=UPI003446D9AE